MFVADEGLLDPRRHILRPLKWPYIPLRIRSRPPPSSRSSSEAPTSAEGVQNRLRKAQKISITASVFSPPERTPLARSVRSCQQTRHRTRSAGAHLPRSPSVGVCSEFEREWLADGRIALQRLAKRPYTAEREAWFRNNTSCHPSMPPFGNSAVQCAFWKEGMHQTSMSPPHSCFHHGELFPPEVLGHLAIARLGRHRFALCELSSPDRSGGRL